MLAARELFASPSFHWLLGNSLSVAFTVAAIVVPLAYLFAFALQRTLIPAKGLWRGISLLPLLAPSMLPAIALVYLFGNQGLLRGLLSDNIYGFWGIVLGEAIYTFPHALMILLSALSLADARLFDAASSMGAGSWRAFTSITWPASRQAVFAAFCLVFTLTITDFGVPVVVGGDYLVLALEAYKAVVGQQQDHVGLARRLPAWQARGLTVKSGEPMSLEDIFVTTVRGSSIPRAGLHPMQQWSGSWSSKTGRCIRNNWPVSSPACCSRSDWSAWGRR